MRRRLIPKTLAGKASLAVLLLLAAPALYIRFAFGRYGGFANLPHWAQLYMSTLWSIMAAGFAAMVVFGTIKTVRDRRESRANARNEALRNFRPPDRP